MFLALREKTRVLNRTPRLSTDVGREMLDAPYFEIIIIAIRIGNNYFSIHAPFRRRHLEIMNRLLRDKRANVNRLTPEELIAATH